MARKLLRQKSKGFFFGRRRLRKAVVFLRRKPSIKFVVTLTDLRYNVIFSCSTGSISGAKRMRKSPFAMELIFAKLLKVIRFHNIWFLDIVLRMRVSGHFYAFMTECRRSGLKIVRVLERYNLPHNGVRRARRPRR